MKATQASLDNCTDDELIEEALDRGLVLGVETRDIVELFWAAKHDDQQLMQQVVKRLARVHLGKML